MPLGQKVALAQRQLVATESGLEWCCANATFRWDYRTWLSMCNRTCCSSRTHCHGNKKVLPSYSLKYPCNSVFLFTGSLLLSVSAQCVSCYKMSLLGVSLITRCPGLVCVVLRDFPARCVSCYKMSWPGVCLVKRFPCSACLLVQDVPACCVLIWEPPFHR